MREVVPLTEDDGSSGLPGKPSMTKMSWCGWKCVASAHSTWLSSLMSMSLSTAITVFRYGSQPSRASMICRASPSRLCSRAT
ncbi:hypothetical protein D3C72_1933890 [compost metagenome]